MPSRNIIKEYVPNTFYHVYARGISKQKIFLNAADYRYFYHLLERYLSTEQKISAAGVPYPHYYNNIQLIAYCLMTNHLHLLIYQEELDGIQHFMRSLMTSYSRYFNLRYKRTGPVFESRYKATRIDSDQYLQHISRYIHLNPRRWENYRNSSLRYYRKEQAPVWLNIAPVKELFVSAKDYMNFLYDYRDEREALAEIKHQLADY